MKYKVYYRPWAAEQLYQLSISSQDMVSSILRFCENLESNPKVYSQAESSQIRELKMLFGKQPLLEITAIFELDDSPENPTIHILSFEKRDGGPATTG